MAHVDQARTQPPSLLRTEPEPLESIGTVAVHEHVGTREQLAQPREAVVGAQVEPREPLAESDLELGAGLRPVRRIDAQHLGTEAGQQPRRDRSGEHACQVEHPQSGERTIRHRPPASRFGGPGIGAPDAGERLARDRRALRVPGPRPR
ncbi:hypothetical protein GCM10025881_29470 [Pseudolysinimonas kribbensis]|uniref:DUF2382 domain-containing protein n=1 Tax=Pseudolysinimonas kribbensis TaxID=433641 RepID=A0ABQ6K9C2_9MICO|nr:hypothetical protein GCM10025881_29470 [Pseudolysinimonas kribbensis]